mgnify:CR=1 FL=1
MASRTYFNKRTTTNKTGYWNKNANTQPNDRNVQIENSQENIQFQEKNMVGYINVENDTDKLTNLFGILNEFRKNNGLKYTRGEGIVFFSVKSKFLNELSEKTPFKISKFKTRSEYECDPQTANLLLEQKDSFIRMNWDADTNILTFMSRTHAKIHGNLIRRIFKDASLTLDTAYYKIMRDFGSNGYSHSSQKRFSFSNNNNNDSDNENEQEEEEQGQEQGQGQEDEREQGQGDESKIETNVVEQEKEQTDKTMQTLQSDGFECVKTKKSSRIMRDTKHKEKVENEVKPSKLKARGSKIKKEIIEVVESNEKSADAQA